MIALKRVYLEPIGMILLKAVALMLLVVSLNGLANFVAIRLTLALVRRRDGPEGLLCFSGAELREARC